MCLSPDEITDTTLLLITEMNPYAGSIFREFDLLSTSLNVRAITASAYLRAMPYEQRRKVLAQFSDIERLTNQCAALKGAA